MAFIIVYINTQSFFDVNNNYSPTNNTRLTSLVKM